MEKLMQAMCVLLLLLLSIFEAAAATSQPTMPRPFLKGSMPADEVIDGNGAWMIHMKQGLLAFSRNTPMGYPPPPKIDPPYHG